MNTKKVALTTTSTLKKVRQGYICAIYIAWLMGNPSTYLLTPSVVLNRSYAVIVISWVVVTGASRESTESTKDHTAFASSCVNLTVKNPR